MKTHPLIDAIRTFIQHVHIAVTWEHDPYYSWDGDGPDPRDEGYYPNNVTVAAQAIVNGELVEGKSHLGGTYERPGERDSDIGGYFPQMLQEALEELLKITNHTSIQLAINVVKGKMQTRYDEQMKGK